MLESIPELILCILILTQKILVPFVRIIIQQYTLNFAFIKKRNQCRCITFHVKLARILSIIVPSVSIRSFRVWYVNKHFITRETGIPAFPNQELYDWIYFHVYIDWPKFGQSPAMDWFLFKWSIYFIYIIYV